MVNCPVCQQDFLNLHKGVLKCLNEQCNWTTTDPEVIELIFGPEQPPQAGNEIG